MLCVTSKASDQPAHTRSLIRAFARRLNILQLLSYWLNIIWSFLKWGYTDPSECTHVKMPHCWKSHVTAHQRFLGSGEKGYAWFVHTWPLIPVMVSVWPSTVFLETFPLICGPRTNSDSTWYSRIFFNWAVFLDSEVITDDPSFVNAKSDGARIVNGPVSWKNNNSQLYAEPHF